jgi:hypothetical protein
LKSIKLLVKMLREKIIFMIIKNKIYWKLYFSVWCCPPSLLSYYISSQLLCVVFDVHINVLMIIITYYLRESIKFLMDFFIFLFSFPFFFCSQFSKELLSRGIAIKYGNNFLALFIQRITTKKKVT